MAAVKKGLGKGLDSLIPKSNAAEQAEEKEKQTSVRLKTSQIEPNRNQPRKHFDNDQIEELANSIKQYGIIQPIVVCKKGERYEIVAGERRWRAAKKAGLKEVPVIIGDYSEKEIAEISLIENIQREDLNPIEEALAYRQLTEEYNLTQEELSQRISKSRAAIANTMRLLKLQPKVQKLAAEGKLSAGHARALLGIEDPDEQLRIAEKVVNENLSVRQTEDLVKFSSLPKKSDSRKIKNDAVYRDLEKKMTSSLGTKVRIRQKTEGSGKIEISYFSEDQLDQIYRIINGAGE